MAKFSIQGFIDRAEAEVKSRAIALRLRLDVPTRGFASLLWRAIDNFGRYGPREAAALAYYALFSLFPLLMLLVVGFGRIIGPATTGTQIQDFLTLFLPGATAIELSQTIERFVQQGNFASIVAIPTLIWSSLGLFSNLEGALSRTFRDNSQRPFLKRRIVGVVMVLSLGILLIANIITSLLFSFLDLLFLNRSNVWVQMVGLFIPFGFSMGIFAVMYRFIPRTTLSWSAIWPAALIGGVAWEGAKRIFGWYLDSASNLSVVYGSITTVIIFMLWTYYTCNIILLCAEFAVSFSDWIDLQKSHDEDYLTNFAGDYYTRQLAGRPPDIIDL